eukprot:TRINITY_DN14095_c0_g2_i2.p1 TRINITY_DN14095_c0_g2~~TRINITY_DN14095_c0_g2_i2.p1  ORF type:complete len:324 (+),score=66.61 TRINITY_DN14095_c0_g2_i2:1889-2860(+)
MQADVGRKKIAVAVTITNDTDVKYADLTAAVAESIHRWRLTSKYDIDQIAFVRKGVVSRSIPYLKTFGFRVVEKELPITVDQISSKNKHYKEHVDKSGCCGLSELMKLYAYQLTDYHRVLHIDMDVLIVKNIDEIIGLPDRYELIHTNSTFKEELVSGGVLLIKPNPQTFLDLLEIIKGGDYRYDGSGWEGSKIGYSWGGETVQGVLPFYYLKKLPQERGIHNASLMLDRCRYNHQGSNACNKTLEKDISIIHMTVCQKPFRCLSMGHDPLCKFHQNLWWNRTHSGLDRLGIARNPRCDYWARDGKTPNKYVPFNLKNIVVKK